MQNSVAKKIFAVGTAIATALMGVPFVASAAAHAVGTNVNYQGTIWMITSGNCRAAYTSAGAFTSYGFNSFATVVDASAEDLALPVCASGFIPPQDGKLITSDRGADKGTTYLISGGMKRGFTSASVFTALGFKFSRGTVGDVSWMQSGANIDSGSSAHLPGVLINNGGTVQLVGNTGLMGIPDIATFNSWGYSFADVVPANAADKAWTQTGVMTARQAGQLSPTAVVSNPTNPTVPTGAVVVSNAAGLAASAYVPKAATNVPFLKFNVTNNSGTTGVVTQVTVKRTGAGSVSDISNVYLFQGPARLTSGRTVNSSTNEAVFSGLNISVPAYGSVTLDVLGDIASGASAGNQHAFGVTSVVLGSVSASGTSQGNFMTVAGTSSGTVTIEKSGTITNPKVGQSNVKVAEFKLTAGSSEDVVVKRISLYQSGSVSRSNFANFKLMQAGLTLATAPALDSKDKANFEVNFALAKGDSRTFEVYADIAAGARSGTSETIKFYVEESTDLFAVGQTFGFGAGVTRTSFDGDSCTTTSGDCSYSYVEGGKLTITFNGPASKDIAKNGKDVELYNFTVAAQNNLEVRQLKFTFNNGGSGTADFNDGTTPNYTDIKIVDTTTNQVVWGPVDLSGTGSATSQDVTFTEDFMLAAGQSKTFKMTADVQNYADIDDGEKIGATLVVSDLGSSNLRNLDNNTYVASTEIVPTSSVPGNQMTVRTSGLTVGLSGTPTSKSYVKGTQGVDAAAFTFAASTAQDVKVTAVTITSLIEDDGSAGGTGAIGVDATRYVSDNVLTVELYDGATKVGSTESPTSAGTIVFNGLNWSIPAGQTKTLTARISLSSAATSGDELKFGIASSGVTAVDKDGNTVTVSGLGVNVSTSFSAGTIQTVQSAGTITAAAAGTEIGVTDSRIVTAGQQGVTLGKIRFTASNEDLKLSKVRVNLVSASSTALNIQDNVSALYLYDGATKVAGPVSLTPSGSYESYADFNSISPDFVVTKDNSKNLTVTADLLTISAGADSGDEFAVSLSSSNFEARGVSGSTLLTSFSGAYTGNYVVLRKGQPKVELVTLPTTTLVGGTTTLMRFKITAVDNNVSIKHITFNSATTSGVSNFASASVRESGSGSDLTVATPAYTFSAGNVKTDMTFSSEQQIDAGTSKTYDFRANITVSGTGQSVSTSIAGDTAAVTGDLNAVTAAASIDDLDYSPADAAYNFIWSDMSAIPHDDASDGSDDWTNGRYVKVVPSDSQALSTGN